jgi:hypothetical protein
MWCWDIQVCLTQPLNSSHKLPAHAAMAAAAAAAVPLTHLYAAPVAPRKPLQRGPGASGSSIQPWGLVHPQLPALHDSLQVNAMQDDILVLRCCTLEVVHGRCQAAPQGCREQNTTQAAWQVMSAREQQGQLGVSRGEPTSIGCQCCCWLGGVCVHAVLPNPPQGPQRKHLAAA